MFRFFSHCFLFPNAIHRHWWSSWSGVIDSFNLLFLLLPRENNLFLNGIDEDPDPPLRPLFFPLTVPSSSSILSSNICCLLSDKFVCILWIATPPSSCEKSKPRWTPLSPVAISVRLPRRSTSEGLELVNAANSCTFLCLAGFKILENGWSPLSSSSLVRRVGSSFRTSRNLSISVGEMLNPYALQR